MFWERFMRKRALFYLISFLMLILASQAMAEEGSERKFTNRPQLKGEPGWHYIPSKRTNGKESEPQPLGPAPLPPEKYKDFMTPDYSNRYKFEEYVFKKIGVNPFKIDIMAEVRKYDRELPEIFNQYFKGEMIWADRDKMNSEQAEAWNDEVKRFHAFVHDKVTSWADQKSKEYKWMMDKFNNAWKEYQAKLQRYRDQR